MSKDSEESGFDHGFLAIALQLNRMRLLNFQSLRELHRGDLDQAQISSALMTVTVGAGLQHSDEFQQRLGGDGLPDPAPGSWPKRSQRIRELVVSTGLPRETIRRKLHQMESYGEVERDASGRWMWAMSEASKSREAYRREFAQLLEGVQRLRDLISPDRTPEKIQKGKRSRGHFSAGRVRSKRFSGGGVQELGHDNSYTKLPKT